jgi:hypothetical protein
VDLKRRQAIENIVVLPIISKQNSHHKNLNDPMKFMDLHPYGYLVILAHFFP